MFLLLLAAQAAASAEPAKQVHAEPKKFCEYKVVTGSRSKKKVCRDENGNLDVGPGIRVGEINMEEKTIVIPVEPTPKNE